MAILNICVEPEKMRRFQEYVIQFTTNTRNDCEILKSDLRKLQNVSSKQELYQISKSIEKINDIVLDAQPALKQLSENIEAYLYIIGEIEKIAN